MKWIKTNNPIYFQKNLQKIIEEDFFILTTTDEPYLKTSLKWYMIDKLKSNNFIVDEIFLTYDKRLQLIVPNIIFKKNNFQIYKNKDAIREQHIWKDVEWGKRKKNYHTLGKDPGNVWIPVNSKQGKIINHIIFSEEQIHNRIKKYLNIKEIIHFISFDINGNNTIMDSKCSELKCKCVFRHVDSCNIKVSDSADLAITSPPYWNLKNYNNAQQIGFKDSYDEYRLKLCKVYKNVFNVLKDDSFFIVNVMNRTMKGKNIFIERDHIEDIVNLGFKYVQTIYWHKPSAIPTKDKLKNHFETFTVFSKGDPKFGWPSTFNSYNNELDYKNIFRINNKFGSIKKDKIHPAVFPQQLIENLILTYSVPGDTVIDPFSGTGTTAIFASINGRVGIGWELNKEYINISKTRLKLITQ